MCKNELNPSSHFDKALACDTCVYGPCWSLTACAIACTKQVLTTYLLSEFSCILPVQDNHDVLIGLQSRANHDE